MPTNSDTSLIKTAIQIYAKEFGRGLSTKKLINTFLIDFYRFASSPKICQYSNALESNFLLKLGDSFKRVLFVIFPNYNEKKKTRKIEEIWDEDEGLLIFFKEEDFKYDNFGKCLLKANNLLIKNNNLKQGEFYFFGLSITITDNWHRPEQMERLGVDLSNILPKYMGDSNNSESKKFFVNLIFEERKITYWLKKIQRTRIESYTDGELLDFLLNSAGLVAPNDSILEKARISMFFSENLYINLNKLLHNNPQLQMALKMLLLNNVFLGYGDTLKRVQEIISEKNLESSETLNNLFNLVQRKNFFVIVMKKAFLKDKQDLIWVNAKMRINPNIEFTEYFFYIDRYEKKLGENEAKRKEIENDMVVLVTENKSKGAGLKEIWSYQNVSAFLVKFEGAVDLNSARYIFNQGYSLEDNYYLKGSAINAKNIFTFDNITLFMSGRNKIIKDPMARLDLLIKINEIYLSKFGIDYKNL